MIILMAKAAYYYRQSRNLCRLTSEKEFEVGLILAFDCIPIDWS